MSQASRKMLTAVARRSLVPALALVLTSCAGLQDTWKDATEVFDLSLTTGGGFDLNVRATESFQLGLGSHIGDTYGLIDGRLVHVREQRHELGVSMLHWYEYRRDGRGKVLDIRHPRWGDPGFEEYSMSPHMLTDREPFDLGAGLHVGYLGFNTALHLSQLADFITGLVGYDLLKDDAFSRSREELVKQAHSLDARLRAAAFNALLRRGEDIHGYAIYTNPEVRPAFQKKAVEALSN